MGMPIRRLHFLFTALLCWLSLSSFAMDTKLQSMLYLYENGQYEDCIQQANTYLQTKPKEPLACLLVAMPSLQIHLISDGKQANEALKLALLYSSKAKGMDKFPTALKSFTWEWDELKRVTEETADGIYNTVNRTESAVYYKYLASIWNDTTKAYREFFMEATPTSMKLESVENEPIADLSDHKANMIIDYAESLMGTPYRRSGSGLSPEGGFDCSGYVCYVYKAYDINLPHGSQNQSVLGKTIPLKDAQKGDLIFFGSKKGDSYYTSHVGIVHENDNGQISFIHASSSSGVTIDGPKTLSWDYWKGKILFVKRIFE
ncbi:MAG: C40 family peptidase [Chitinophagales bacterium]|nr:C40 family peptidase [Chitinophagales bacterium]